VVADLEPATLASGKPYPVPPGAQLAFRVIGTTTDGWMRGDVLVIFPNGSPPRIVARAIPASGGSRTVKVLGDWAKIFPEPLPVRFS